MIRFHDDGTVSLVHPRGLLLRSADTADVTTDRLRIAEEEVRARRPDMARLAGLPALGVIATAPGRSSDFVSRFFAPKVGVPEDPVTGSSHCTLVPYWAGRLDRTRLRARWTEFFRDYDALLCPVTVLPAFPHLQEGTAASRTVEVGGVRRPYLSMIGWTTAIGAAYLPATVPPVGFTEAGLPVGVQVVGPYLEDRTSLFVARELAGLIGGYRVPPMAH